MAIAAFLWCRKDCFLNKLIQLEGNCTHSISAENDVIYIGYLLESLVKKVLAVASGGGHWVQLLRLRPAFEHHEVVFMTTNADYAKEVSARVIAVTDANIWDKLRLLRMFMEVFFHMLRIRPHIVITTGAAPGFAAVLFGRLLGARTIWVDSIANSEELSNSGKKVKHLAHVWLTQWEHLRTSNGPDFWGAVL